MLAGRDQSTTLMFNGIKDDFSISKIIIEKPVSKKILLRRRINKLGLAKVIGQVAFMIYINFWLKKITQGRIKEIKHNDLNDQAIDESIITKVDSVNSEETKKLLIKHQPDVVIVHGTRIIKKDIIDSIDAPFINTHYGITPKYRGIHGGYWALTENDSENCGVTVHLVDIGIDTGDILYQGLINVCNKDNYITYPYLQMIVAIPLMKKAINDVAYNNLKVCNNNLPSKLWSHPTFMEYIKYRILYGIK